MCNQSFGVEHSVAGVALARSNPHVDTNNRKTQGDGRNLTKLTLWKLCKQARAFHQLQIQMHLLLNLN